MMRCNTIYMYLALSAINGFIPALIALLFSVQGMAALLIWGIVTVASFALICLMCLGSAMKNVVPDPKRNNLARDLNEKAIYN